MKTGYWKKTGLILLLLVAVLVIMGAGSVSSAPYGAVPAIDSQVATTLQADSGDTFIDVDSLVDGGSQKFVAVGTQDPHNGNDTWAAVTRYDQVGNVTWQGECLPENGQKIDEVVLWHSGNLLGVSLNDHEVTSTKPRAIKIGECSWPVYSTRPGQESEEGGSGAFVPTGGSSGLTDEDLAKIQAIIHSEVDASVHTIVDSMIPKTTVALSTALQAGGLFYRSDGLYSRISETSYQSAINALNSRFGTPTATPHP